MGRAMDAFLRFLESRKLKVTGPRLAIAREIFGRKKHFTPDDLVDRVRLRDGRIGRVTVYRTLALLAESGLLGRLDVGRGRSLYEPLSGVPHHDHLVCVQCGGIAEFQNHEIERLQDNVARSRGFTITAHALKLYGYCKKCRPRLVPGHRKAATASPRLTFDGIAGRHPANRAFPKPYGRPRPLRGPLGL
ncbi:MAG: transcriptional repressor [Planctomycetes bacterium]|nr:transcriptional repressor [Planctomycetota bacterium]